MPANLLLTVLLCGLLVGCSTEYNAVYQRADAESKWDESARINLHDLDHEPPLYRVEDNKLYLAIQITRVDRIFHTVVNYPSWDKAEMSRLVEEHAEIKSLIPVDWNNWLPKGYGEECIPG